MYVNVCVSRHLKGELAWATDKWLWVISNKMLFKTVIPLRNWAVLNLKQYCMHCYVTLSNVFIWRHVWGIQPAACWPVIMYIILLFVFNTICYGNLIFKDWIFVYFIGFLSIIIYEVLYTPCLRYNICSTCFLSIRISTCFIHIFWPGCTIYLLATALPYPSCSFKSSLV